MRLNHWPATPAILTLCLAAGCATTPAPTAQMALANTAVSEAQSAGATQYAPVEFRDAQDKLARARTAMAQENYVEARRLAEESEVDARLAETRTRNAKAQQTVAELRQGIQTLRRELERQSPAPATGGTR